MYCAATAWQATGKRLSTGHPEPISLITKRFCRSFRTSCLTPPGNESNRVFAGLASRF